ncbi:MAG: hypothetical protein QOF79_711, partial [Actinomycetota bacterium]|nr:hypothetical protein [Actinomycetota bacterium]
MVLEGLIGGLSRARTFENALSYSARSADFSLVDGLRAPLLAGLMQQRGGPQVLLAITATGRESEGLRSALASLVPHAEIIEFPAWETLPHERLSPSAETVGKRIDALRRLRAWEAAGVEARRSIIVVASVRAALQPLADNLTDLEPITLTAGGRGYDLTDIARQLVDLAYARVDMVTRRGEFAVRGGILDVFSPIADHPVRVEFFGDEVEQLRFFSVADQRSIGDPLPLAEFPASRELLLSETVRQRAREMQHEFPSIAQMLAKISEGIPVEGMESLAPALVDKVVPLTDYLPKGAAIAVLSPERVATRAVSLLETNREFLSAAWSAATAGAEAPIDLDAGDFLTLPDLRKSAGDRAWWTLSTFDSGADSRVEPVETSPPNSPSVEDLVNSAGEYVRIEANSVPNFAGQVNGAVEHVRDLTQDGWTVAVAALGPGLVERAADVLGEHTVAARIVDAVPEPVERGIAYLLQASVES